MILCCPCAPPLSQLLSVPSFAVSAGFWLVVVYKIIDRRPSKASVYFIAVIVPSPDSMVQTIGQRLPYVPPPCAASLVPLYSGRRLSGWLWYHIIKRRPHKANPPPIILLYDRLNFLAQTKEPTATRGILTPRTWYRPMMSHRTMYCEHRWPTHGERGQSRWRVGWQWLILLLCVLCFECECVCVL